MGLFSRNKSTVMNNSISVADNVALIEEIHNSFYSEVNNLLSQAKNQNSIVVYKQELIDKKARLEKLGFKNTPEIQEAELEIARIEALKHENLVKQDLIAAINYFSVNYPEYKFITEESVVRICNQYGLVYSEVQNFRGNIPLENLEQMEKFNIDEKDSCYISYTITTMRNMNKQFNKYINYLEAQKTPPKYTFSQEYYEKCPLEICAPLNQFDITDLELDGKKLVKKKIEIKDPIVLCPVIFRRSKHYLIVTAWGEESHDSEVINNKLN